MNSLRYIIRRMFRSFGFSSFIVITIALAAGINLGVFSVTKSILFHTLGVPESDRIVYFAMRGENFVTFSGRGYEALRANSIIKDILAWKMDQFRLKTKDSVIKVSGSLVTGNTFSVFGLTPSLGRFFNDSDDAPGGGKDGWAAVLGYSYWKTHFDANPNVIGQNITVDGAPVHIVGVLPQDFTGLSILSPTDILLPRHFEAVSSPREDRFANPGYFEWFIFGRLPQGISTKEVQANLDAIEPSFRRLVDPKSQIFTPDNFPNIDTGSLLLVQNGQMGANLAFKTLHTPLLAMEALAATLFLFCCCNLILLFVGRAIREAHATAIRIALGARMGNEAGFAMLEAVVLAAFGCLIAVPIAWSTARILSRAIQAIPGFDAFPTIIPGSYLLFEAVGITLTVACLTGAGTSIWQGRKTSGSILRVGTRPATLRSNTWIIRFEVFASIVLITVAVVDGISFQKLARQPSGFYFGNAVLVSLDLEENSLDATSNISKEKRILDQIEVSPGVQSVATINIAPLSGGWGSDQLVVHGENGALRQLEIWPADVSAQYFSAVGTRIVRGRNFSASDISRDSVCVLSSRAASAWFYKGNPIGEYIYPSKKASMDAEIKPYCRIVGVAEDVHFKSMSDLVDPVVYRLDRWESPNIVVKAATAGLAIQAVRDAAKAVDPAAIDGPIETIQERVDDDLRLFRIITLSGVLCACIAAIILGIGFFGILSLQVAERRREIGIQIALGANRTQVCVSVMKKLRRAVLIGLVFGSGAALLAAVRLAEIYNMSFRIVIAGYLGSLVLLLLLLVAAASVPLRRALAVSPMECLNSE